MDSSKNADKRPKVKIRDFETRLQGKQRIYGQFLMSEIKLQQELATEKDLIKKYLKLAETKTS